MKLYTFSFTMFGEIKDFAVCGESEKSARAELIERFRDAQDISLMQEMNSNLCPR